MLLGGVGWPNCLHKLLLAASNWKHRCQVWASVFESFQNTQYFSSYCRSEHACLEHSNGALRRKGSEISKQVLGFAGNTCTWAQPDWHTNRSCASALPQKAAVFGLYFVCSTAVHSSALNKRAHLCTLVFSCISAASLLCFSAVCFARFFQLNWRIFDKPGKYRCQMHHKPKRSSEYQWGLGRQMAGMCRKFFFSCWSIQVPDVLHNL